MKRLYAIATLCVALGFLAAPLILVPMGCTTTVQTQSYKTIYSLEVSTTAAYDAYLTSVVKGAVATNDLPRVTAAYNEFQVIAKTATLLIISDTNAPAPPEVIAAAAKVAGLTGVIAATATVTPPK